MRCKLSYAKSIVCIKHVDIIGIRRVPAEVYLDGGRVHNGSDRAALCTVTRIGRNDVIIGVPSHRVLSSTIVVSDDIRINCAEMVTRAHFSPHLAPMVNNLVDKIDLNSLFDPSITVSASAWG